jgi:hypothetical protein
VWLWLNFTVHFRLNQFAFGDSPSDEVLQRRKSRQCGRNPNGQDCQTVGMSLTSIGRFICREMKSGEFSRAINDYGGEQQYGARKVRQKLELRERNWTHKSSRLLVSNGPRLPFTQDLDNQFGFLISAPWVVYRKERFRCHCIVGEHYQLTENP